MRVNDSYLFIPLSDRKTATPKRSLSQFRHPIKRRRIDNAPSDDSVDNVSKEDDATRIDFLALKRRICIKRQELDNLRTKSNYIKKVVSI